MPLRFWYSYWYLNQIKKTFADKRINLVAGISLILLGIPALIRPLWGEVVNLQNNDKKYPIELNDGRGEHIWLDERGIDYNETIAYVDSLVPEGEKIYVGTERHDRIFTNDVMFYFLAERESPTKYYELHPGLATTREVQQEIIKDISEADVKVVVLKEETTVETENLSGVSSGVLLLDNFIRQHYAFRKQFGYYSVWSEK